MPAGSVRALLGISVLAQLWLLALASKGTLPEIFIYLLFLKVLILVHYYAAHGKTLGAAVSQKHALGLPRGSVRLLMMGGFIGLLFYLWHSNAKFNTETLSSERLFQLIALMLTGFFVGHLLTAVFRAPGGVIPAWLQDVQAWAALLAALALGVIVLVYTVINPGLEPDKQLVVDHIEMGLAGLIGFYFGARS
jgi:hypothetical protein